MSNIYRDVTLNQVSEQDIGKTIRVAGWVENIRDHGGVSFIDLRYVCSDADRYPRWKAVRRNP